MAAIDPVEQVKTKQHEAPISLDLPKLLSRLAALPPSLKSPYLTVSLDWRPLGDEPGPIPPPEPKRSQRRALRHRLKPISRRPARLEMEQQLEALLNRYHEHTPAFESLKSDIERIGSYLDNELDPAAHGVFIVANHQKGVWRAIPLDVPVATEVKAAAIPALKELVHAVEGYPSYAVVVAEQHQAVLWQIERLTWEQAVEFESSDYPHHQKQGAWSQKRFQNRADERVEHFAKEIASQIRRAIESKTNLEYLVIAADEPMYSALTNELHESVKDRLIGRIHVEIEATLSRVIDEAEALVQQAERRRELEAVRAAREGYAAGGNGVLGIEETLTALQAGQVLTLVMNDDFHADGWADYSLPIFGTGPVPSEHPAGGKRTNLRPTALEDEMIRLTLAADGARVELVWSAAPITKEELEDIRDADEPKPRAEAAEELDQGGGVAAILRYALDSGLPTARLWSEAGHQSAGVVS
jgi:protein required for attachment to host cells